MCELGLPSLDAVYSISWREFQLRRSGYLRQQKAEWDKVLHVSYYSGAGTAFDPKKLTLEQFTNRKQKRNEPSKSARSRYDQLMKEYLNKKESHGKSGE